MKHFFSLLIVSLVLSGCGAGSKGVFGTGVSIALDPRTLGMQIDDSIMDKGLEARLIFKKKRLFNRSRGKSLLMVIFL